MNDLPDFELRRTVDEPAQTLPQPVTWLTAGLWAGAGLLIIVAGLAVYIMFGTRPLPVAAPVPTAQLSATRTPPPPRSLGGEPASITVPPLDESDQLVRQLVRALSSDPLIAAWLTTNGLIRDFAMVVADIADGSTPARHLIALRPAPRMRVIDRRGVAYIDAQSYARYARIANAVASVDPAGAARLYATLKPRIEEAYRDLGFPDGSFDRTLEHAIVTLLNTPILDLPVAVRPKGIGYAFADDRLEEDLTGAQKQLLRMGPRNVRIIERRLRTIGLALGIRPGELPADESARG